MQKQEITEQAHIIMNKMVARARELSDQSSQERREETRHNYKSDSYFQTLKQQLLSLKQSQ